jgi:hypothetical protein
MQKPNGHWNTLPKFEKVIFPIHIPIYNTYYLLILRTGSLLPWEEQTSSKESLHSVVPGKGVELVSQIS